MGASDIEVVRPGCQLLKRGLCPKCKDAERRMYVYQEPGSGKVLFETEYDCDCLARAEEAMGEGSIPDARDYVDGKLTREEAGFSPEPEEKPN